MKWKRWSSVPTNREIDVVLKSLEECADRIEAARLGLGDSVLLNRSAELRRNEVNLLAIGNLRREAERLLEACKSVDKILADHINET
jgi:hypothetical protein